MIKKISINPPKVTFYKKYALENDKKVFKLFRCKRLRRVFDVSIKPNNTF